jgi:hypothetical protein
MSVIMLYFFSTNLARQTGIEQIPLIIFSLFVAFILIGIGLSMPRQKPIQRRQKQQQQQQEEKIIIQNNENENQEYKEKQTLPKKPTRKVEMFNCSRCYRQFVEGIPINAKMEDYPDLCYFCRMKYAKCAGCNKFVLRKRLSKASYQSDFLYCGSCIRHV